MISSSTRRREIALNASGNYPCSEFDFSSFRARRVFRILQNPALSISPPDVGNEAAREEHDPANRHCDTGIERRRRAKPVIAVKDSSLLRTRSLRLLSTSQPHRRRRRRQFTMHIYVLLSFSLFLFLLRRTAPKCRTFRSCFRPRENKRRESLKNAVTNARSMEPPVIFVVNLQVFSKELRNEFVGKRVDRANV